MEGEKMEKSTENREGQVIETFKWKGKQADIRFAKRTDGEGFLSERLNRFFDN